MFKNLWICIICGHIGCSRYQHGHAISHFKTTQHLYSMELTGEHRVWDYASDNYVHRLMQNKADGKLVQMEQGQMVKLAGTQNQMSVNYFKCFI